MKIRPVGKWVITGVSLLCLALCLAPTAQAQVKLEHKFPEGRSLKFKTTATTSQVLTIAGQEIETKSSQTVIASSKVGKKRDDSSLPVEQKVESLKIELSLPMGLSVNYDSSDPNAKIDNPQLAFLEEVFKLSAESAYTVVLDNQNKVKAIEGSEKLLEKADKLSDQAKSAVRSRLQADALKKAFEQELRHLPDVLARPGESWERTEVLDIGSGQTLTFHKKYEYVGTEKVGDKTLDKITSKTTKAELKQDPAAETPLKLIKSDVKVESSGGTILFDREAGYVGQRSGKHPDQGRQHDLFDHGHGSPRLGRPDHRIHLGFSSRGEVSTGADRHVVTTVVRPWFARGTSSFARECDRRGGLHDESRPRHFERRGTSMDRCGNRTNPLRQCHAMLVTLPQSVADASSR